MISIRKFQDLNKTRGERWHKGNLLQWSLLEWTGAMAGEAGEACNAAKKLRQLQLELPNKKAGLDISDIEHLRSEIAKEVADTIIYGMLILSALGVDAENTIQGVFNQKSSEYGFPEIIVHE